MSVVTRFAPSPTGHLHIGGARTALFNWLLARNTGGKFVLRIEDTDRKRSSQEMTDAILASMSWLGMDWDGEPIYQTKRMDVYNKYIDQLLDQGKAYWCECTPEQVDAMREKARAEGKKPKYDLTCRERDLGPGDGRVVRLKTPVSGQTSFKDLVKGVITVENTEMDDMILRRSDGTPTYNLAVVVDDHEMGVTHAIRGDDHVNNTPRQLVIYQALGWEPPVFGHVPMILGPDKKKLSKRHGALSAMEYEKMGYLPEAMVSYLARLGWSSGDQEIFTREELVKEFNTDNLGSSAAVFDTKKLDWVDSHFIKEYAPKDLVPLLARHLAGDEGDPTSYDPEYLEKIIPLYQPRSKTMVEMAEACGFFLEKAATLPYDEKAVKKFLKDESVALLTEYLERLEAAPDFTEEPLEDMTKAFIEEKDLKFKHIAQPIRVSISGKTQSPGLFETMVVLGREETLERMKRALTLGGGN